MADSDILTILMPSILPGYLHALYRVCAALTGSYDPDGDLWHWSVLPVCCYHVLDAGLIHANTTIIIICS